DFPFDRPGKGRPRLGTADAVMAEFPAVRAVIDAKEPAFRRPAGWDEHPAEDRPDRGVTAIGPGRMSPRPIAQHP
ncbi:MAG TPA: hypothetical protein VKE74_21745, partial [Gemmataceae bacterium]|nr:hypothetical protein [Gemmataceae bacterium]